jgi:hypothetical protein
MLYGIRCVVLAGVVLVAFADAVFGVVPLSPSLAPDSGCSAGSSEPAPRSSSCWLWSTQPAPLGSSLFTAKRFVGLHVMAARRFDAFQFTVCALVNGLPALMPP